MSTSSRVIAVVTVLLAGGVALALIPASPQKVTEAQAQAQPLASVAAPDPTLLRTLDNELAPPSHSSAETIEVAAREPIDTPTAVVSSAEEVTTPPPDVSLRPDRIGSSAVNLRAGPASSAQQIGVLQAGEAVQVGDISKGWAQVTLADGSTGWVYSTYLASYATAAPPPAPKAATAPVTRAVIRGSADDLVDHTAHVASRLAVYARPRESGESMFVLEPGDEVRIAEVRGDWLRVETDDGDSGWIRRAD